MRSIQRPDQYLKLRGDTWHYVRRVPKEARELEGRATIYRSLETDSRKVARQRRNVCAAADEQRWSEVAPGKFGAPNPAAVMLDLRQRASTFGFTYRPVEELVSKASLEEIFERLEVLGPTGSPMTPKKQRDADAVLGVAEPPKVTISQALDLYLKEIALDEQMGKSPEQLATYTKVKRRAVANFVKLNADMDIASIGRDEARKVYRFWADRVQGKGVEKPMSGNSANRDLGNLRKLYRRYFEHIGEESRENPFRNLRFASPKLSKVRPFSDDWVRERILAPGVMKGLNRQAALLCYAMIETGCRPSELSNIEPENIRLDAEVPHIRIRNTTKRQLKSTASIRDIPLVGISLEAMKHARDGFPHYRERGYLLSQSLAKGFKVRGLMPSEQHRLYSFRHSFEKRMLEAGIDYGLRCTLMGHRNPRPEYGDGGSL
jgi:integrase